MSSVYDTVVDVFVARFNVRRERVQPDSSFNDLGLDSLSQIEFAIALQKRLGVKITDDDIANMSVVSEIVATLEEKGVRA